MLKIAERKGLLDHSLFFSAVLIQINAELRVCIAQRLKKRRLLTAWSLK